MSADDTPEHDLIGRLSAWGEGWDDLTHLNADLVTLGMRADLVRSQGETRPVVVLSFDTEEPTPRGKDFLRRARVAGMHVGEVFAVVASVEAT